jgi:hypothetical protein
VPGIDWGKKAPSHIGVSLATDGSYVYIVTKNGLSKIGTGNGTIAGKQYAISAEGPFSPRDTDSQDNWLLHVWSGDSSQHMLLYHSAVHEPEYLYQVDPYTLSVTIFILIMC